MLQNGTCVRLGPAVGTFLQLRCRATTRTKNMLEPFRARPASEQANLGANGVLNELG
jgi:hypothetical protein